MELILTPDNPCPPGANVATIRAVVEVEAAGSGFFADGRPKILFEAHWFSEFTNSRYDYRYPSISSPVWNRSLYIGGVGEWAMKWAFGEIWARPQLSRRDRSLVVIAILTALGQEQELAFHVPGGLNHGLTREEIEEIMTHLCLYAGFPRAVDGMRAARRAFAQLDAET